MLCAGMSVCLVIIHAWHKRFEQFCAHACGPKCLAANRLYHITNSIFENKCSLKWWITCNVYACKGRMNNDALSFPPKKIKIKIKKHNYQSNYKVGFLKKFFQTNGPKQKSSDKVVDNKQISKHTNKHIWKSVTKMEYRENGTRAIDEFVCLKLTFVWGPQV